MTVTGHNEVDLAVDEPSPSPVTMTPPPKPSWLLIINSRVILYGLVALLTMSVVTILFPSLAESGVGYLGALASVPMLLTFGIVTFLSVERHNLLATSMAVALNFGTAALTMFGVVANVGEALQQGEDVDFQFVIGLVVIGFGIAAYFSVSGLAFLLWAWRLDAAVKAKGRDARRIAPNVVPER